MSDSKINFQVTIMSEETEEEQQSNADYGYPLHHNVVINAVYDSGIVWTKLLEKACEAIGAYYGYDVKEKVFVKQFGNIVNIVGHDELMIPDTDSEADENPTT